MSIVITPKWKLIPKDDRLFLCQADLWRRKINELTGTGGPLSREAIAKKLGISDQGVKYRIYTCDSELGYGDEIKRYVNLRVDHGKISSTPLGRKYGTGNNHITYIRLMMHEYRKAIKVSSEAERIKKGTIAKFNLSFWEEYT